VLKLQGAWLINQGTLDLSGGERAGAILAQSGSPAPGGCCAPGRVQVLDGPEKGGFLYYGSRFIGVHPPTVKVLWPTGRLRAELPLSFATGIRGIGTWRLAIRRLQVHALLMLTDDRRLLLTSSVDILSGNPQVSLLGELANLNQISQLAGFTPTDVAQSPQPPHHIFISGVRGSGNPAQSEVHEFDSGGNYIGMAFNRTTCEGCFGSTSQGHLRDIDFLSDGRLAGLMTTFQPFEPGIHAIDLSTGTSSRLIPDQSFASMSVFRGDRQDLFYVVQWSPVIGGDGGPRQPTILRYNVSGQTAQAALALETISSPGEPGLLRLDGALPAANAPRLAFDSAELPDLRYNHQPTTFNSPTIGSFSGPVGGTTALESLVFGQSQLTLFCQGGEATEAAALWKMSQRNPQPFAVPTPPADGQGQFMTTTQMDTGFNTVWVETNRGGPTHALLNRHVLYIRNANVYPPRP
jgi:hypothetical protein